MIIKLIDFNPRVPCGTRRKAAMPSTSSETFQSTRPMRDATRERRKELGLTLISIHASHAGRDLLLLS